MKRPIQNIIPLLLLLLCVHAMQAQVEKGITSIGKEVDCSTFNPAVDQTVNEYGAVVTHPRLTNYGKLITEECGCPVELDCTNCTGLVTCVSIALSAPILSGTVTSAVLQVFSDSEYSTQVGGDIAASVADDQVTALVANLNCHTRYYLRLILNNKDKCTFDWSDSTRDKMLETPTYCTVATVLAMGTGTDKSHEHQVEGTNQIDSVYDMQNNAYTVVQIGDQCWMKQNMRCIQSPKGILASGGSGTATSLTLPRYYNYSSDVTTSHPQVLTTLQERGLLYNWPGILDTSFSKAYTGKKSFSNRRGICPKGWHLPTDAEWKQLEKGCLTESNGTTITDSHLNQVDEWRGNGSGKLAGGCYWTTSTSTSAPGNYSYAERNVSGFSAHPAGYRNTNGEFTTSSTRACFWSSSACENSDAYARYISSGSNGIDRYNSNMDDGFSLRCLRNPEYAVFANVDSVTCTTMKVSAQVVGMGTLTGKTVAAYTNAACTTGQVTASSVTTSNDSIYATLTGLNCNTTYYIKVTAINSSRTVQAVASDSTRDISVEAPTYCTVATVRTMGSGTDKSHEHQIEGTNQIDSVYDHQGNVYGVVQIENQCWLKENMRCETSPSTNHQIVNNSMFLAYSSKFAGYYENSKSTYGKFGVLYNWCAAVDTFNATGRKPEIANAADDITWNCTLSSNHRGVCPKGWHIPTSDEWTTLTSTVGIGQNSTGNGGLGKLAGGCEWHTTDVETASGNYSYSDRNATGFSAIPAGGYAASGFDNIYDFARFWSATSVGNNGAYARDISYSSSSISSYNANRRYGFSVRCLRNPEYAVFANVDSVTCTTMKVSAQVVGMGTLTGKTVAAYTNAACTTGQVTASSVTTSNDSIYATLTGLNCNTTYYIKVTAINSSRTVQAVVSDSTRDLSVETPTYCTVATALAMGSGTDKSHEHQIEGTNQIDSVYDHQGNVYGVVQIGNQCWLKENMRCTTSPKGNLVDGSNKDYSYIKAYYYNNITATQFTLRERGLLYNWPGALDTNASARISTSFTNRRGICPQGWHIPTDAEWITLEKEYLTETDGTPISDATLAGTEYRGKGAGKYAGGCDWSETGNSTTPNSYLFAERNISGYTVIPAGHCLGNTFYTDAGKASFFWTSTMTLGGDDNAWDHVYSYDKEGISHRHDSKCYGFSVRCVRDMIIPEMSVCEDTTFGTITLKEVKNAEKIEILQGGTVVRTINSPTDTIKISGLAQGTYKVKTTSSTGDTLLDNAYVKHTYTHCTGSAHNGTLLSNGKLANNEWSSVANQIDSVSDHEGNVYEVVQINNQCWLKENMRATTSPSTSHRILKNTIVISYSSKSAYWYKNDSTNYSRFGVLYNWCAAVDTFDAASSKPELAEEKEQDGWRVTFTGNRRGICPKGWHVPSDEELTSLVSNAGVGQDSGEGLGKLVNGCDWSESHSDIETSPGNPSYSSRNSSGFSAIPAGYCSSGFGGLGESAYFWSSTPMSDYQVYNRAFNSNYSYAVRGVPYKHGTYSVRCVRN